MDDYLDNITYMTRDTRLSINGGTRSTLEASAYEVPVSSTMQLVQNNREQNCQSLEATYALPYEYATQGPNETKVFNISGIVCLIAYLLGVCWITIGTNYFKIVIEASSSDCVLFK